MQSPNKPNDDDCCNSGCNPCVFDVYEKQLKIYLKLKEMNMTEYDSNNHNGISEINYTKFCVIDVLQITGTLKILKLKRHGDNKYKIWWKPGDHFLIRYSNNNKSCSRAYTPIELKTFDCNEYDFLIVVKRYDNGLVSNYLYNLKIGDETFWRGPYGSYKIESHKYNRVVMVAQGTGIAPFVSIINDILNKEDDITRIFLYFCCKNIDEIIFRNILYEYNYYWNFTYKIFLSNEDGEIKKISKYNEPLVTEKFNIKCLEKCEILSTDQILLCGSQKFMEEYRNELCTYSANIVLF